MSIKIIYESSHLLVVNKPAGWTVERSANFVSVEEWAWQHVEKEVKKPFIGIIHRLDRPVSGLLLLAKKKIALKQLNEQFRQRKVRKTYLALVNNEPQAKSEKIQQWLIKDQKNKKALISPKAVKGAFEVTLHYQLLKNKENCYLLEVHPYTGKFHQIRAQLAAIGSPILGDEKYGGAPLPKPFTIALHAHRLSFYYPFLEEQHVFSADMPKEEWWRF